jgi:hypothetical protein
MLANAWPAVGIVLIVALYVVAVIGRVSRPLLKFSGGHSLFRLLPDRTWWLF